MLRTNEDIRLDELSTEYSFIQKSDQSVQLTPDLRSRKRKTRFKYPSVPLRWPFTVEVHRGTWAVKEIKPSLDWPIMPPENSLLFHPVLSSSGQITK